MRSQYKPKARKIRANLTKLELDMRKIAEEIRSLAMPYGEEFKHKVDVLLGAATVVQKWNENILKEME